MTPVFRIRLLSIGFVLFGVLLIGRLYMVQIVSGKEYQERADRQYSSPSQRIFDRGTIYFTTKDNTPISAATLDSGYTLAINPTLITNAESTYTTINAVVPLDHDVFVQKATRKNDPYEEIAHRVSEDAGAKLAELNLAGVRLFKERWRSYPGGTLASQVVGFLSYIGDDYSGHYGLEKYYEDTLKRSNQNMYVNFFAEIFSDINQKIFYNAAGEGDVTTTIEPNVELTLEKDIKDVNQKYHSKLTAGIVMNPQNGEIYAMAAYPSFDPNFFQVEKDPSVYNNPLVQGVYEMGSVIKPLTMAAGIDAGVVTPSSTYFDAGKLTLNNSTLYNYDKIGRGKTTMQEVLNQSLNTGAAYVALQMGREKFDTYFNNYGFTEKTGIDLPGEPNNLMNNLKSPRDIEHATAAFGQGIAMTPVSTIKALATLGNGGYLVTPHIAKKIDYTSGVSRVVSFPQGKQVLSKETSLTISRMLTTVVDTALLNGSVKLPHYSVAAKTGTAQIADSRSGGYYSDRYMHTFFGYFPSYNPKFLIFLYTIEPQGEAYASHTLTTPFMDMVQFLINYYDVPPDR